MSTRSFDPAAAYATPPVAAKPDRACADVDARVFYPHLGRSYGSARTICGRCPHRRPCLDWALATGQRFGFWGGKTPSQRERMLKGAS